VGLAVPLWDSSFRDVIEGVCSFFQETRRWKIHLLTFGELNWGWIRRYVDGLLLASADPVRDEARILRMKLPTVEVMTQRRSRLPTVSVDSVSIGRTAAEHLLSRGIRQFAYLNLVSHVADEGRERGFVTRLAQAGHSCERFRDRPRACISEEEFRRGQGALLRAWVRALPKPVGVMAFNDFMAQSLVHAWDELRVGVPERVAVIGVDNCPIHGQLSHPRISSVIGPFARVGYEAARRLERLMDGEPVEPRSLSLPAVGVAARQSTDFILADDADLAAALRFIREHAHHPIGVKHILGAVPLSRRRLERRFRAGMGRTLLQELHRVRIELAKELLSTTSLPMPEVAVRSGFGSGVRLSVLFRRATGSAPSEYRRQTKLAPVTR
jgi:LacI family transcriptional regulator